MHKNKGDTKNFGQEIFFDSKIMLHPLTYFTTIL